MDAAKVHKIAVAVGATERDGKLFYGDQDVTQFALRFAASLWAEAAAKVARS